MRAIAIVAAGLALVVVAAMLLIAPPHYFIVYGGTQATSGSFNDGYKSKAMQRFGKFFYALPDVGEGGATIIVKLKDGTTKICVSVTSQAAISNGGTCPTPNARCNTGD